jgi:hypothetical protein
MIILRILSIFRVLVMKFNFLTHSKIKNKNTFGIEVSYKCIH